jgi:hypothetical protein
VLLSHNRIAITYFRRINQFSSRGVACSRWNFNGLRFTGNRHVGRYASKMRLHNARAVSMCPYIVNSWTVLNPEATRRSDQGFVCMYCIYHRFQIDLSPTNFIPLCKHQLCVSSFTTNGLAISNCLKVRLPIYRCMNLTSSVDLICRNRDCSLNQAD